MNPNLCNDLNTYLNKVSKLPHVEDYDAATRDEIVQGNLKLVVSIAKEYSFNADELQDLIQEGNIGLLKAADTRKPGKGFAHWASLHIRSSIRNYLQGSDVYNRYGRHGAAKTDAVSYSPEETEFLLSDMAVNPEKEQELLLLLNSPMLTSKQKEVLEKRLTGFSLNEVATQNGVSHQAVRCCEQAAIRALAG